MSLGQAFICDRREERNWLPVQCGVLQPGHKRVALCVISASAAGSPRRSSAQWENIHFRQAILPSPFAKSPVQHTYLTQMCLSFAGGVHNGEYVPWLYCYDPVMDVWARKQDMNTKRAIHTLAVMNDRLYAIGGNHLKGVFSFVCFLVCLFVFVILFCVSMSK